MLSKAREVVGSNGNLRAILQCHRSLVAGKQTVKGGGGVRRDGVLNDGAISVEHATRYCAAKYCHDGAEVNTTVDANVLVRPREVFSNGTRSGVAITACVRVTGTADGDGEAKAGCVGKVHTASGVHQDINATRRETRGLWQCRRSLLSTDEFSDRGGVVHSEGQVVSDK